MIRQKGKKKTRNGMSHSERNSKEKKETKGNISPNPKKDYK